MKNANFPFAGGLTLLAICSILDKARIEKETKPMPDPDIAERTGLKTASKYQLDIFHALESQLENYREGSPTTNIAVEAVAGSGKTTTIVGCAKLIPQDCKAVFLAFNKSIADELRSRLPSHVEAKTLNGLGFGILHRHFRALGISEINLDGNKVGKLARKLVREGNPTFSTKETFECAKEARWLVSQCKSLGIVSGLNDGEQGIEGQTATDDAMSEILSYHGKVIDPMKKPVIFDTAREILRQSSSERELLNSRTVDFDDQKWLPACKQSDEFQRCRKYDVVFIDEVQDVNSVDLAILRLVLKENGIVIGVGDSRQAIYGFRGADTEAFSNFVEGFNCKTLPLSITYRCGKKIVEHAQRIVPTIEAAPGAHEGEVKSLKEWEPTMIQPNDLVLCRTNAPCILMAYSLVKEQRKVVVKGRNIGVGLIQLIEECVGEKKWQTNTFGSKSPVIDVTGKTTQQLNRAIAEWKDVQMGLVIEDDPDNEAAIQRIEDQYQCVKIFVSNNTDGRVETVVREIEALFSDDTEEGAVVISTIHKAKGLEAENVFIIRPDLLNKLGEVPWQVEQEANLDYVARTRPIKTLTYLHKKEKPKK